MKGISTLPGSARRKIDNRQTDIQIAYDDARFRVIDLNQKLYEIRQLIKDQERIISTLKRRAGELGISDIL